MGYLSLPNVTDPKWRREGGFIYFIQPVDGGLIKIGRARCPGTRIADIGRMCPIPLRLLRLLHGGCNLEKEIHHYFRDERQHGEWFDPSERLLRWMAGLSDERFKTTHDKYRQYRTCRRCKHRSDIGRQPRTCKKCGSQDLANDCVLVCCMCGVDVLDTDDHLVSCGGLPVIREAVAAQVLEASQLEDWVLKLRGMTTWDDLPEVLTVEEVGQLVGSSVGNFWKAVDDRRVPTLAIGKSIRIPRRALQRFLEQQVQNSMRDSVTK
jgi:excisionase family DNA binding protein